MAEKIIVSDMHGPVYIYKEGAGIELVEGITPEESEIAEHGPFEEACRRYARKSPGKYDLGMFALEGHENGSIANLLELEEAIVMNILDGKDDDFGIALNMSAAGQFFDVVKAGYRPVIISTSRINTSRSILERALNDYKKECTGSYPTFITSLPIQGIPVCNISEFGSKKDPNAWIKSYANTILSPFDSGVDIVAIIEDGKPKLQAAYDGARSLGFNPATARQITKDNNLYDLIKTGK